MFTKPRPNVIESDEGFSVEILGREGLRYHEGPRSIRISSEILAGPAGLALYQDSITRWDDQSEINEEEKRAIIERVRRAFRFEGFEIETG